jgi:hypothetical protein
VSLVAATAGVAVPNRVALLTGAAVVNDQAAGAMALPARSLAPLRVAV